MRVDDVAGAVCEALPSLPCAECQDCECRLDCRCSAAAADACSLSGWFSAAAEQGRAPRGPV